MEDEDLRISCMNDNQLHIQPSGKATIIGSLEDDEEKLRYMQDSTMGFNEKDRLLIICSLQDEKKFEKFGLTQTNDSYKKSLGLPSNMTIGIELEAEGEYAEPIKVVGKMLNGWKVENESTLEKGVEIVSPILHSEERDVYSLSTVCNVMQKLGLETNERCARSYTHRCRFFRK